MTVDEYDEMNNESYRVTLNHHRR